jgi:hypothetical protein
MTAVADPVPMTRRVFLCALAAVSFCAVAVGVRQLVPWPEEYGLRAKYDYFREHKDEFDGVLIGSSRVFRGFDPRVIDEELASRGIPFRSFNIGVGGMVTFEMDFLLRNVAALKPARMRWMFFEGGHWDPATYFLGNTWSTRSIFWHDVHGTREVLRSIHRADLPVMQKIELAWTHLRLFGMKQTNMAQGKRIVLNLLGVSEDPLKRALSPAELEKGRGYQALDEFINDEARAWRDNPVDEPPNFQIAVDRVVEQNTHAVAFERYNFEALRAEYAAAKAIGARLVIVIPPMNEGAPDRLRLHERGEIPYLIDLNSPERFPQFFKVENRFDEQHMNGEGARDLSRLFAAELAALLERAR